MSSLQFCWIVFKVVGWVLSAVALIFAVNIYDNYVAVDKENITINSFLNFGRKTYSFNDIAELQYVRVIGRKGYQRDLNYRIVFKDGYIFDSKDNMLEDCKGLIDYLSATNKITIER